VATPPLFYWTLTSDMGWATIHLHQTLEKDPTKALRPATSLKQPLSISQQISELPSLEFDRTHWETFPSKSEEFNIKPEAFSFLILMQLKCRKLRTAVKA
jgi:hypothetical protein